MAGKKGSYTIYFFKSDAVLQEILLISICFFSSYMPGDGLSNLNSYRLKKRKVFLDV